jgi:ribosome-associated protein
MPAESPRRRTGELERKRPGRNADDARAFAVAVARLARDAQSADVDVLDLRQLSNLADYFVIGTSRSDRQARAVLDAIADHAKSLGRAPLAPPNDMSGAWMLADYVDVVVHLFDDEHRGYYDLDGLWGDAPRVAIDDSDSAPDSTRD